MSNLYWKYRFYKKVLQKILMEQKLFFAMLPQQIPLNILAIPVPRAGVTGPVQGPGSDRMSVRPIPDLP